MVARIDVDYRRPLLFRPEPYVVTTRVARVGTSSYTLESEIRDGSADGATVLSRASAVLVAYDLSEQRSRPLTSRERDFLAR